MSDAVCDWTVRKAVLLCLFVSVSYVAVLYLLVPSQFRHLSRNDSDFIRYRTIAVTVSKVVSFLVAVYQLPSRACTSHTLSELSGVSISGLVHIALSIGLAGLLMIIFYLGEFVSWLLSVVHDQYNQPDAEGGLFVSFKARPRPLSFTAALARWTADQWREATNEGWVSFRAIIFAPVSEELAFRSLICASLYTAFLQTDTPEVAAWHTILHSIGWFGVAHLHHLYDSIVVQRIPLQNALVTSVVQFLYTSIFGFIAATLLVRTGSIYPAILSHVICNFVGLPNLAYRMKPVQKGDQVYYPTNNSRCVNYPYRHLLDSLQVLGLMLFSLLLWPSTAWLASNGSVFYAGQH